MSLTAIQNYVQTQLQGLVGAYGNQPLVAWVDAPSGIAMMETPQAYVLSAEGEGVRQTMAYTAGYYEDTHQVYVTITWAFPPNFTNANLAFTNLMDTAIARIRTNYQGAILVTDPATQAESQLLVIGDKLRWRYLPEQDLGESGQEWFGYFGQIIFEVKEKVQYLSVTEGPVVML